MNNKYVYRMSLTFYVKKKSGEARENAIMGVIKEGFSEEEGLT